MTALIALTALLLPRQAQAAAPHEVTYQSLAEPLPKLLTDLSPLVGKTLNCAAVMKTDIVAVNFSKADPQAVLDRIAQAEEGSWSESGGTYWLSPDPVKMRAGKAAYQARMVKLYSSVLDKASKTQSQAPMSQAEARALAEAGAKMPNIFSMGLVMDNGPAAMLLLDLGVNNLVDLGPYNRKVFSSNPNSMQIQLPASAENIITGYFAAEAKKGSAKAVKIDCAVSMTDPSSQLLFVSANGYTANGTLAGTLAGSFFMSSASEPKPDKAAADAPAPSANSAKITFSPSANALIDAFQVGNGGQMEKLLKQGQDALSKPESVDPLAYPSELIVKSAAAKNENLVALLPDTFFKSFHAKSFTADQYLETVKNDLNFNTTDSNGWIVVQPSRFEDARTHRTSRKFLTTLTNYMQTHDDPDIDSLAQMAVQAEDSNDVLIQKYVQFFQPGWILTFGANVDYLALYGNLSTIQRDLLSAGKPVYLATLSGPASKIVSTLLYSGANIRIDSKTASSNLFADLVGQFDPSRPANSAEPQDIRREPTELCPDGLPAKGYIGGSISSQSAYKVVLEKTDKNSAADAMVKMPIAENLLAMVLGMSDVFHNADSQMPKMSQFIPGIQHSLTFKVFVGRDAYLAGGVSYNEFSKDAQPMTQDQVMNTPSMKKAIAEMKKRFSEMQDKMKDLGGSGPKTQP